MSNYNNLILPKTSFKRLNIFIIILTIILQGCSFTSGGGSGNAHFSVDGSKVAYIWYEETKLPYGDSWRIHSTKATLIWCDVNKPEVQRTIPIIHEKISGAKNPSYFLRFLFSPNSKYLALVGEKYIYIINFEDGKLFEPIYEKIKGFSWITENEFYLSAIINNELNILKHDINDSIISKNAIYRQRIVNDDNFKFYWSPTGKYAIFQSNKTLNMFYSSGNKIEVLFGISGVLKDISWRLDETACAILINGLKNNDNKFIIYKPSVNKIIDLSGKFKILLQKNEFKIDDIKMETYWTPDNKYIIVNKTRYGGCLIHPESWKIYYLAKIVSEHYDLTNYENKPLYPALEWFPVKGWIKTSAGQGDRCLVDYHGQNYIYLNKLKWAAFSHNGKHAATVNEMTKNIIIHNVNFSSPSKIEW